MTFDSELLKDVDAYVRDSLPQMLDDLGDLIAIPSTEGEPEEGAPYGREVRRALDQALGIANRFGFATNDGEGYVGYASMPGSAGLPGHLATIAHVDVVPAGDGWHFPPFTMTQKDGWLIGRGTDDDKNAAIVTLYAARYLREHGGLRHDLRLLFGCNEETGMHDIPQYLSRNEEPLFCLVPDVYFPVTNGEKGMYAVTVTSAPCEGAVLDFQGGSVSNAVPGKATVTVRCSKELESCWMPGFETEDSAADGAPGRIAVRKEDGVYEVTAFGKAGHAAEPEEAVNAIGLLVQYLLQNDVLQECEKPFFGFLADVFADSYGEALGMACQDQTFGALTAVGGTIRKCDGRFVLTIDCRFPGNTSWKAVHAAVALRAEAAGATIEVDKASDSFFISADSQAVRTCVDVSNSVLGHQDEPEVISGTTFARMFRNAVRFGLDDLTEDMPDFVGMLHGPDEGFSVRQLQVALKVYILTLLELDKLDYAAV